MNLIAMQSILELFEIILKFKISSRTVTENY